jgi:heme exporter protein D
MSEFFQMGGYAAFVWPAYGLTAFVLLGLTAMSLRAHKAAMAQVAMLEAARPSASAASSVVSSVVSSAPNER